MDVLWIRSFCILVKVVTHLYVYSLRFLVENVNWALTHVLTELGSQCLELGRGAVPQPGGHGEVEQAERHVHDRAH